MRSDYYFDEFCAIDFETATKKRNSACSMAIVHVKNGEIIDRFSFICQPPDNQYDRQNIAIHRIFPSQTENEPTLVAYHKQIYDMLNNNNVVAHNVSFDRSVLYNSLEVYGLPIPQIKKWHCTYNLTGLPLDECCADYGIELTNHHEALADATACAQLYIKLTELSKKTPAERKKEREELLKAEINNMVAGVKIPVCSFFAGKNIVATGVFHNFIERELLRTILEKCGANIRAAINKKTDYVVCGEMPGPQKMEKVAELNNSGAAHIEVLTEDQLIDIFEREHIEYKFETPSV